MDRISLTYFVDFVLKAGAPKLTGVRDFKENKDEAFTDFYKQVRDRCNDHAEFIALFGRGCFESRCPDRALKLMQE